MHDLETLTAAHPHLAPIVEAYVQWADPARRDIDIVVAAMAADVALETVMPDGRALPSAEPGRESVRAWLTALLREWELVDYRPDGLIVGDDGCDLVMIGNVTLRHRASGREGSSRLIDH